MRHKYTAEQIAWLKDNVKGKPWKEIAAEFNKQFSTDCSISGLEQISRKMLGLCNGCLGGRFVKGQKAWNKGIPMKPETLEKIRPTLFKKGHKTWKYREVGSERLDKNGYIIVKVADPKKWRRKHFVEWKKYHEPIDISKEALVFLDGNRLNCDISNLKKVSRSQLAVMSKKGLWQTEADCQETALLLADVIVKTHKLEKRNS